MIHSQYEIDKTVSAAEVASGGEIYFPLKSTTGILREPNAGIVIINRDNIAQLLFRPYTTAEFFLCLTPYLLTRLE